MKILAVDDHAEGRYLLELMLKSNGYDVDTASNGEEALAALRKEKFDAVVSDIMMPCMDGFELCHRVKSDPTLEHIPLIFYTATYTSDEDERFALSIGADAFLLKPQSPEDLLPRIREVLSRPRARAASELSQDQLAYLREYNARLVNKLEEKFREAEEANRRLKQVNESLEARVKLRTSQLEESNSNLEAFAYSISHDLRAHLRGMTAFARLLEEDFGQSMSATAQGYVQRIQTSGERMGALIEDILAFSRALRSELKLEQVKLDEVVDEVMAAYPEFRGPHARIEVRGPLGEVMGNAAALRQCLFNLLSNAVKYVVRGETPEVIVRSEQRGTRLRLWVEDKGIGISPGQQATIFEMFQRLHNSDDYEGTGLGLAIVQKAVERMGGKAGVESELGDGSRFWIELQRPD